MGIGAVPDAVLASLSGDKHLGIHTEMWTDGALALIKSGVVRNSRKPPGQDGLRVRHGDAGLVHYIDDNPSVAQLDIAYGETRTSSRATTRSSPSTPPWRST